MAQIVQPDVAHVARVLDSVGQRYRMQQVLRGAMLFVAVAAIVSMVAGMLAHWMGAGAWTMVVLLVWATTLATTAAWWVGRPVVVRQRPEWVARLVEQRVESLHNSLTNTLLLARRDDIQSSPLTPLIYSEVRQRIESVPINRAVTISELLPVVWRCVVVLVVSAIATLLLWPQMSHGWRQMLAPGAFVPKSGSIVLTDIRPGDATLIKSQPLEVLVEAEGLPAEDDVPASLYLDPPVDGRSVIALPRVAPGRFAARIEHVDAPLRYRVEVGGTQSRWFDVRVIDRIKLTQLQLLVTPPAYIHEQPWKTEVDLEAVAAVPVPVGSKVEIVASVDHAVSAAMLQLAEEAPREMRNVEGGIRFAQSISVENDVPVSILLANASGQIIARLPDPALQLKATPDEAPRVSMRWPSQDVSIAPGSEIVIRADVRDDLGLTAARVLVATTPDGPLESLAETQLSGQKSFQIRQTLPLASELRKHGTVIRVRVEATDNRDLSADRARQTTQAPVYNITLRDAEQIVKEAQSQSDKLRDALRQMLLKQQELHTRTVATRAFDTLGPIVLGQSELRDRMLHVADTFEYRPADANVKKTLYMLVRNPAQTAIDLATALPAEPSAEAQGQMYTDLQAQQRRIISTLESLLAMLVKAPELTDAATRRGGDLPSQADALKALKDSLEAFMKEQRRILDQTAPLAKKPVDDFSEQHKKTLDDLTMAQEKLDAFMQEKISDFSKLAEQDMSNAAMLAELMEVYSEVTMAKDALKKRETEIAVSAEEMGVELAQEITSNLEKWLVDTPDRIKWDQEDPLAKTDVPMAELPEELEDMIGELMEQQEDILEEAEDTNANWADSLDKGAGWDAMDGPIANMSAKGVTGNQLPNNNEMGGRAGEGRSGKSQGEMVEETASGKGGRNTPTRLDPTPFQQGQIKDESKDPVGGATGGGKLSGQGGSGLEGPVPPGMEKEMKRLAEKQAQLRNAAERLNIKYQLGRYDNFKLLESIAIMRRIEADLDANRYQNVLRRKDVVLDAIDTSRMLVGGEIHVQHDTTPALSTRMEDQIHDAMKGDLPPAWSEALKTYYEKLGRE
jgi:hypothetical protein